MRPLSPLNFVNWSLGHESRWPVRIGLSSTPSDIQSFVRREEILYRRWVEVRDGRKLTASLPGAEVTLDFLHPAHLRQVRQWIKSSPRPFLQRIEMSNPFESESEGELCFVRGALPGQIEGRLFIVVPPDLPASAPYVPRDQGAKEPQETSEPRVNRLSRSVALTSGRDTLLIAASPLLPVDDIDVTTQPVVVFATSGERLLCQVDGPPGAEFLRVTSIESTERRAPNARLLSVPNGVQVVDVLPSDGADLSALQPRPHENLAFWIQYEREALRRAEGAFDRRYAAPLEYDEADRDARSDSWLLRLVNGQAALSAWVEQGGRPSSREIDVDASIELRALDHAGEGMGGTLLSIDDADGARVVARVRVDRLEEVPPIPGKIIATEERGDIRQRDRRDQALRRLQTGHTASPELLQWLYAPQLVPAVNTRADVVHARAGHAQKFEGMQSLAIRGAAQCPGLFLIQGPPGTGKTSVIVEIVHELRRRYRKPQEERGPLRILIASVQNEAVQNVVERLQTDRTGLQVQTTWLRDSHVLSHALTSKATQLAERARESALARSPRFARWAALYDAHERLSALVEALAARGLTGEVLALCAEIVAADSIRTVLAPVVLRDIEVLFASLETSSSGPGELTSIASDLAALCEMTPPSDKSTQASVLRALDELEQPSSAADEHIRRILDTWRRLRPLVVASPGIGPLAAKLSLDWSDAVVKTREMLSVWDDHELEDDGFTHPRLGALCTWSHAALQAVHDELCAGATTVEAAIFNWIQALQRAPREVEGVMDRYAPVAAATCQRAALAAPSDQVEEADFFDVAIIDEAARAGIDVLIPMTLARSIILVGDQLQLPPYVEDDLVRRVDQVVLERVGEAEPLFTYLWRRLPSTNRVALTKQYRMHEEIGRIVSKVFYEPAIILSHFYTGDRARERQPEFGLLDDNPIVWVDTADVLHAHGASGHRWPCYEENPYEAEVVLHLLGLLRVGQLRDLQEATGKPPVGIISFYRAQKERLETDIRVGRPELETLVNVGTVDGFQGREFPLVILSCVRSNSTGNVGFLSRLRQRINVAMSRAQRQLIIVGDASTLAPAEKPGAPERGSRWLRQVHALIAETARVYPSAGVMGRG